MDRPAKTPALVQPSIRSFFQPRPPAYAAPPSTAPNAPPKRQESGSNSNSVRAIESQPLSQGAPAIPQPPPLPQPSTTSQQQPPLQAAITLPPLSSIPTLPPPPFLPSQAAIVPITASHIAALRRINSLLLQIPYPDSFYTTILNTPASSLFSRAILWSDSPSSQLKVIGSIVCRLEPASPSPSTPAGRQPCAIYIQSLALLSPYRRLGLAAAALEHIISTAYLLSLSPQTGAETGLYVSTIYAHVWTENADGLRWYSARGFVRETSPVAGYYFRLRPDTAWVVRREIGGMASAAGGRNEQLAVSGIEPGKQEEEEIRGRGGVLAAAVNLPGLTTTSPPPGGEGQEKPAPLRPGPAPSLSYQKARPETEWNDLPADMVAGNAGVGPAVAGRAAQLSAPGSGASSRSSSSARRKKERTYPAAAFGS